MQKQHFFLDEAGDPTFYGKGKRIIVGQQGVSTHFILRMVGFRDDLAAVRAKVLELQREVLASPYFGGISSIEKKKQQHGYFFHATDDIPEVRKLFFDFIKKQDCSFEAVIATKIPIVFNLKHGNNSNEFYAELLSHLLCQHIPSEHRLVLNIAKLAASTRHENLMSGLEKAVRMFNTEAPLTTVSPDVVFNVQDQLSEPLLNIADYLCWSLQRVYEKGERRFYNYIADKFRLKIHLYGDGTSEGIATVGPEEMDTMRHKKSPLST